jgi:hypothetical protein
MRGRRASATSDAISLSMAKRGSFDVGFAPKATILLRRREVTRRADSVEKLFSCDAGCPLIQSLH